MSCESVYSPPAYTFKIDRFASKKPATCNQDVICLEDHNSKEKSGDMLFYVTLGVVLLLICVLVVWAFVKLPHQAPLIT